MSTINANYTSNANTLTQQPSAAATSQVNTSTEEKNQQTAKLNSSEIVVSSRAQKLQALSSEFFSGNNLSTASIEALKERAYEYGLISEVKYKQLSSGVIGQAANQNDDKTTTMSLADELNKVEKELVQRNSELPEDEQQDVSSIVNILSNAVTILDDPETAVTKEQFDEHIANTIKELNEMIASDTFGNLPVSDRVAMTNAAKGLSVIESIAPRNATNNRINQYLANAFR